MKYFEIIYVPKHRSDKEWIHEKAETKKEVLEDYKDEVLVSCTEITEEEYDEML